MEKLQYILSLDILEKGKTVGPDDHALLIEAEKAMQTAYAPYSAFKVGAAVLLDNGRIITGNNQENAAYPSGLCAERVALFYAMSQNSSAKVKAIAVSCESVSNGPITPCGACRQVIAEYEQKQGAKIRILMGNGGKKVYAAHSIESLLPFMFSSKNLLK